MADAPELSVNVSASTSAFTPALAVGAAAGSGSGFVKSAIQELIISTLNIPIHLTDRSNKAKADLRMAYAKYVALLAALKSMSALVTSGTWTHQTVTNDDIIEIFMSKSAYFQNHSKVFTMVDRHPQMKMWLLNADGGPSDDNVWGYQKRTFDVLKAILTPMAPVDIKGKGKEMVDLDLSSSPVDKRKRKEAAKTLKKKKKADYDDKKEKKKGEGSGKA